MRITSGYGVEILKLHKPLGKTLRVCREAVDWLYPVIDTEWDGLSGIRWEKQRFNAPAYKRVDIGMSYRLLNNEDDIYRTGIYRYMRNVWLGIDAFNLLDINNVNSYYWVSDVDNNNYAVPNYLTGRRLNFRLLIEL
jgi:hypothetical protein